MATATPTQSTLARVGVVARMVGCSTETVRRWAKEGRLPALLTVEGDFLIDVEQQRPAIDALARRE